MYLFDQPVSLSQRLYRGLRFATKYYKLERGEIICDKAFVSTSSRSDFSRSFGKHSKEQYLFEITGHFSGKDVGKFGEAEVLFPPGCTFLVDRVEGNHVWMHEVQLPRSNELSEQVDLTVSNATPKRLHNHSHEKSWIVILLLQPWKQQSLTTAPRKVCRLKRRKRMQSSGNERHLSNALIVELLKDVKVQPQSVPRSGNHHDYLHVRMNLAPFGWKDVEDPPAISSKLDQSS
jgi:hypothetical protein